MIAALCICPHNAAVMTSIAAVIRIENITFNRIDSV